MIRQLITIALPLLTPFVIYYVWFWASSQRKHAEEDGRPLPHWQELPWMWLIISGALLTSIVLILTATIGTDPNGVYTAPHMENGVIVPGRIEP